MKATIAQFFRISGGSNQHRGVIPDIIFPTARFGQDYGERVLDNALPWDEVKPLYFMPVSAPVESFARARELHEQRIKENRLMESKRKAEREQRRLATAELRNEYRVTLGLEPVPADAVDIEDEDELEDLDPLLDEAARILFDLVVPVRQAIDEFPDTAKTAEITSQAGGTLQ